MTKSTTELPETAAEAGGTRQGRRFEDLPAAAQRALREAEERRKAVELQEAQRPREIGGRGGKDPARYGDWEVKGVAVDF